MINPQIDGTLVGNRIKDEKNSRHLTIEQLEHLSAVPSGTISRLISGKVPNPGFLPVCRLLWGMGINIHSFFCSLDDGDAARSCDTCPLTGACDLARAEAPEPQPEEIPSTYQAMLDHKDDTYARLMEEARLSHQMEIDRLQEQYNKSIDAKDALIRAQVVTKNRLSMALIFTFAVFVFVLCLFILYLIRFDLFNPDYGIFRSGV